MPRANRWLATNRGRLCMQFRTHLSVGGGGHLRHDGSAPQHDKHNLRTQSAECERDLHSRAHEMVLSSHLCCVAPERNTLGSPLPPPHARTPLIFSRPNKPSFHSNLYISLTVSRVLPIELNARGWALLTHRTVQRINSETCPSPFSTARRHATRANVSGSRVERRFPEYGAN